MAMEKTLRSLLMLDYTAYCSYTHKGMWKATRFHKFLCRSVQDFIEKETGNAYDILILSCPPQHGKSTSVTETLPSWYLGRFPQHRVIEISYAEDFARKFGKRNRSKVKEFGGEIFDIKVGSPDTDLEFELSNGVGAMISRGALSGVTGNPANLMIIDDPIKTQQEADSLSYRNRIFDEWLYSFKSRLAPGAKVILIMTRWHEDDLAGRLMATEENIEVLNLPCEAEENDVLGRAVGEALCPEIGKDNDWLKDFKKSYMTKGGTRAWNALYQGRPTGLEGNMIKREWWRYYKSSEMPEFSDWMMGVDAAFKDKDDSDYVAIQIWGKRDANFYLVDAVKKHLNLPDTMREIIRLRSVYPLCITTLIEDKANGSAIIDILRRTLPGIIPVNPIGGKIARVNAIIGAIESGNVYLPEDKPFTGDFIEECSSFPNGKHDDQVDGMSMCLNRLVYRKNEIKKPSLIDPIRKMFPELKKPKKGLGKINVI